MNENQFDVVVIGGGVVGCAIARELSRYRLSICLLERGEDICSGTSKANSAIIHAGFDAKPGTLKAQMNVQGSQSIPDLARELDIPFRRNGALVLCLQKERLGDLQALYERGLQNGVRGLRILNGEEARGMEPMLTDGVVAALYAEDSGIICPFEMTLALAENAQKNGAAFFMNESVTDVQRSEEGYCVVTENSRYHCRFVVNAAGVYADQINNWVSARKLHITPRKGDYCLLDSRAASHVSATIFQLPGKYGKGVLVTPTVHGNLLIGPSAVDTEDRESLATSRQELEFIRYTADLGVRNIPWRQVITSFSGLRAHEAGDDFVLGEAPDAPGFFNAAGIESPGLTSAPAIGRYIAGEVARKAGAAQKADFCARRRGPVRMREMDFEARKQYIREHPLYGKIVCRCEQISEGEIVDAIRGPLGARSLDGVKRRVRAGMGRCQGGFCTPRVMEILSRELSMPMTAICKNRPGSEMLVDEMGRVDS